jgi:hypothetical protein
MEKILQKYQNLLRSCSIIKTIIFLTIRNVRDGQTDGYFSKYELKI